MGKRSRKRSLLASWTTDVVPTTSPIWEAMHSWSAALPVPSKASCGEEELVCAECEHEALRPLLQCVGYRERFDRSRTCTVTHTRYGEASCSFCKSQNAGQVSVGERPAVREGCMKGHSYGDIELPSDEVEATVVEDIAIEVTKALPEALRVTYNLGVCSCVPYKWHQVLRVVELIEGARRVWFFETVR